MTAVDIKRGMKVLGRQVGHRKAGGQRPVRTGDLGNVREAAVRQAGRAAFRAIGEVLGSSEASVSSAEDAGVVSEEEQRVRVAQGHEGMLEVQ